MKRIKIKGWKRMQHENTNQRKLKWLLIVDQVDFKTSISQNKEGTFNNDKGVNLPKKI